MIIFRKTCRDGTAFSAKCKRRRQLKNAEPPIWGEKVFSFKRKIAGANENIPIDGSPHHFFQVSGEMFGRCVIQECGRASGIEDRFPPDATDRYSA